MVNFPTLSTSSPGRPFFLTVLKSILTTLGKGVHLPERCKIATCGTLVNTLRPFAKIVLGTVA